MIEFILHNGIVLRQTTSAGWNLEDVQDIQDCLNETGRYKLTDDSGRLHILRKSEVKEIREEEQLHDRREETSVQIQTTD